MQNMFTAPIHTGFIFAAMVFGSLILVPVGILLYNWISTISSGALTVRAPMLFALGAISTITIGLAAELVQTAVPAGTQLSYTQYANAATHYALVGGAVFGGFAALYYWFPKMTGRFMAEGLGRASFWALLIGVNATFAPMLLAGLKGQPTDIFKFFQGNGLDAYNLISTIGAGVLALGILLTLANAVRAVHHGGRAGHDPWGGATLEWFALSPPPEHNFDLLPDVRSAEPLRDIREALEHRSAPAPEPDAGEPQPVG
jgi:cytochrome c oxidase subunit 1